MEDNGAAPAAPATSMLPAEKHEAIPDAAAAAATNGSAGEENKVEGDAPAPALLPCGPRKTGLHLFVMNIRCVRLLVRSCIITIPLLIKTMLERADELATYDAIRQERLQARRPRIGGAAHCSACVACFGGRSARLLGGHSVHRPFR